MRPVMLATVCLIAACGAPRPAPTPAPAGRPVARISSGTDLLRAMHDRYQGRWYDRLSFVQTTTFPDGHTETWYEALQLPGRLRIDMAPLDSQKMSLFRGDSLYVFEGGQRTRAVPFVHPLLVLGFDVYAAPPDSTAAKISALGFDLAKVHQDTWQGRPAWVVGAAQGDSVTPQFWVDAERLVFVRLIEHRDPPANAPDRPALRIETLFNRYVPLGGGWVAPEVLFFVNGQQRLKEEYHDMRADPELGPALFDPGSYQSPGWVGK